VHHDAAIPATENIAQDAHLKKARKTGPSINRQQYAIGCEQLLIDIEGSHVTI
jgi:hypothetical protein